MQTIHLVLLASFLAPIAIFASIGLIRASAFSIRGQTAESISDELLLASRSATAEDFTDSSVAYMLQVSTTVYFVYWGYNYGFANVFYLLSWGVGLWTFSQFAARLYLVRSNFETIPALVSGDSGWLRRLAGLATIVGFLGVVYVETHFATDLISGIVAGDRLAGGAQHEIWWVFFVALLVSCLAYSCLGGLRKVFLTDKYQLGVGYVGLSAALAFALVAGGGRHSSAVVATGTIGTALFVTLLASDVLRRRTGFKPVCLVLSLILVLSGTLWVWTGTSTDVEIPGLLAQVTEPLGWVTLAGFTILNLLWQFCDASNYQRIAALSMEEGTSAAERTEKIRWAVRSLVLVSPLTWGLGIVLGMAVRSAGVVGPPGQELSAFTALMQERMLAGDPLAFVGLAGIGVAFSSIMLSTADSSIVAAMQTFGRDLRSDHELSVGWGIALGACALPLLLGFAWLQKAGHVSIFVVMASVYTQLVVLAVPVILRLRGYGAAPGATATAIILGSAALWCATFGGLEVPLNVQLVLPILMGVAFSSVPALFGCRGNRERDTGSRAVGG